MQEKLLEVKNLKTYFQTDYGLAKAVDGVSFSIAPGEALGVVGESGCGKSVTAASIMGLVPYPGKIVGGQILYRGEDLVQKREREMQRIRGSQIAMVFQDPLTTLNPVLKVGDQIMEAIKIHYPHSPSSLWERANPRVQREIHRQAWERALAMLEHVGIPAPAQRMVEYPHQFSGGMRQRVMIAIALSCNPSLLIADEPTTALDVTIQAQILDLMARLRDEFKMSIMLITHDLGVVAEFCDRIIVMYAGQVVEEGRTEDILTHPLHPYTKGLLKSIPRLGDRRHRIEPIDGLVPELHNLPPGCNFQSRCPLAKGRCLQEKPTLRKVEGQHKVSCWQVKG
ncbi:MAG: ABC transporter ATP-binding protein [Limnochordia bacterium]|jgi:oligopeptide/dipeptide ABC transporter ATP-binding protein